MFGDGMDGIPLHVTDGDTVTLAGGQIQVVAAGGGFGDEPQIRQLAQFGLAQSHLVDDGDLCPLQPLDDLRRGCGRVVAPLVRKVGGS